ncbi:MAG: hypothetical protein U0791_16010 [Gemmataceae bacterium]
MTRIDTPQTCCKVAFARADITPPPGIYHRMWGAALHEVATGVHKPLTATAMLIESLAGSERMLVIGIDHCILEEVEANAIKAKIQAASGIAPESVHLALSHTHGSAWLSRSRSHLPGGDLIGPYLDRVAETCGRLAKEAAAALRPATIVYGTARCPLAAHRDFPDEATKQIVCGFNPAGPADDTVMLGKVIAEGAIVGTIVNYACHPTTLAWENTLVSPDYIGAMREVVERETGAPCLFLQGASGELGPREGYVGDTAVADRNGRQLGFAALSGLESLAPPGTFFEYAGPVVSGATLGTWKHRPLTDPEKQRQDRFASRHVRVPLAYRVDLPTMEETQNALAKWQAAEAAAEKAGDAVGVRDAHAHVERMNRQIARLRTLPAGKSYPFPVGLWRLGDSLWIFTAGEQYQVLQTELRRRFPHMAVIVTTIADDWQPGYLPSASSYGYGIYQETIAAVGPGALEALIESLSRELKQLMS